jgi:hypothetical protein
VPVKASVSERRIRDNPDAHQRTGATCAPRVREASFGDYDQIAALQTRYQRPTTSFEQWKHLWVNNPAYIELRNTIPIGWVLEREDKNIVGYLGNIPLFYELGGQRIVASVAHAWVVDARYRAYSLALLDLYFSQKSVELFLNATVGPDAFDSFAVFQSLPTPVGDWDRSVFWITTYQGFLESWLAMKGVPLSKPLSYALALAPTIKQAFSNGLLRDGRAELQLCKSFDARFDVFWQSLRELNPKVLLGMRTREVLQWHFAYALRNNEAWIITSGKDRISAYSIFLRHDNPSYGLKRLRLIDYQALDGSTTLLLPMLSWALDKCRKEGIHMLETIGFRPSTRKAISDVAPYERKLPCWLYFYKTRDKSLAQKLSDPNVWDPSQFDGDASL